MNKIMVTIRYKETRIDLELPDNVILSELLAPINNRFDIFSSELDISCFIGRGLVSGVVIQSTETLQQAGIHTGDVLELFVTDSAPYKINAENTNISVTSIEAAYLQCTKTGRIFQCKGNHTLVGLSPHSPINLSSLPDSDAVSREHANILKRDNGYLIKDERSTNGVFVNKYRLETGERIQLKHGDLIQFGENGPQLVFYLSNDS